MNRITFGPRPDDFERVRQMGLEAFLDEQLQPENIDDGAIEEKVASLPTLSMSSTELIEDYPPPNFLNGGKGKTGRQAAKSLAAGQGTAPGKEERAGPAARPKTPDQVQGPQRIYLDLAREEIWRAIYSNRQLNEMMVQFWMNHFNIYFAKGADHWLLTSFERDTIRPNALGNFEDLLVATAQSPAMLFYLDNWMSSAPAPASLGPPPAFPRRAFFRPFGMMGFEGMERQQMMRGFGHPPRRPAQKAERGINENYGRELMELHTLGVDGGYTQHDVIDVARCLTGWTLTPPFAVLRALKLGLEPPRDVGFYFNPQMHDYGPKMILGRPFPGGRGMEEGLALLHMLANHPATARHISLQLCRRFIADDPPASAVARATQTFSDSGGRIRAVMKTILTSPEFYSEGAYQAKVKTPLEFVTSSLRALDGDTDAGFPMIYSLNRLGEPLFQYEAPSGFADRGRSWINSGMLLTRMNFAVLLAANRLPGTTVNLDEAAGSDEASPEALLDRISQQMLGGPPSDGTRQAILKKLGEASRPTSGHAADSPAARLPVVATIAGLLLASPEFQRR